MKKISDSNFYGFKIMLIVIFTVVISVKAWSSENSDVSEVSGRHWISHGVARTKICPDSYCPANKKEALLVASSVLLYGLEWYWKRTNPETYAMINDIRYAEAVLDGNQNMINSLNEAKVEAFIRSLIADHFCPETNWSLWSDCARRFFWEIPGTVIGRFLF